MYENRDTMFIENQPVSYNQAETGRVGTIPVGKLTVRITTDGPVSLYL